MFLQNFGHLIKSIWWIANDKDGEPPFNYEINEAIVKFCCKTLKKLTVDCSMHSDFPYLGQNNTFEALELLQIMYSVCEPNSPFIRHFPQLKRVNFEAPLKLTNIC